MEVPFLSSAIIFFSVAVVMCSSSTSLPAQQYWNQVLPNTPMPKAIKDSLDANSDVSIGVGIGKGGAQVHVSSPKSGTGVSVGKGGVQVHVSSPKSGTGVSVGKGGVRVHVSTPKSGTGVSVGRGGDHVHVSTPKSGTGVSAGKGGAQVHVSTPKSGTGVSVGKGGAQVHVSTPKSGTGVSVGAGGAHVHVSNPKSRTSVSESKGEAQVHVSTPTSGTGVSVSKGGAQVHVSTPKSKTGVFVGKGGATVHVTHPKGKNTYVSVKPGSKGFLYKYAATETQLHDDPNTALFFREKDLTTPAKKTLNLRFTTGSSTTFLPRDVAKSIPFSSERLPEILDRLDILPESPKAVAVESTVKECEEKTVKGEDKRCVDSLEGMVDFATSKLGTRVSVLSTDSGDNKVEKYKVVKATRLGRKADHVVVCHKQTYPYAVFYCHSSNTTRVYEVLLEAGAGPKTNVNAVAVCHTDTSEWNPKHLAFMVLKVKPGTVPVCHFLPQDHVVWVPK